MAGRLPHILALLAVLALLALLLSALTAAANARGPRREAFASVTPVYGKQAACMFTGSEVNDLCDRGGDANIVRRLYFGDSMMDPDPSWKDNNSDPYYLEKVDGGPDRSSLRLTINDDWDESFQIWGNACNAPGGCSGEGAQAHLFRADGYVRHGGRMEGDRNLSVGGAGSFAGALAAGAGLSVDGQGTFGGSLTTGGGSLTAGGVANFGGDLSVGQGLSVADAVAVQGDARFAQKLCLRDVCIDWKDLEYMKRSSDRIADLSGSVDALQTRLSSDRAALQQEMREEVSGLRQTIGTTVAAESGSLRTNVRGMIDAQEAKLGQMMDQDSSRSTLRSQIQAELDAVGGSLISTANDADLE